MENIFESNSETKSELKMLYYDLLKSQKEVTYEMLFKQYLFKNKKTELENKGSFNKSEYDKYVSYIDKEFIKYGYDFDDGSYKGIYSTIKKIIPEFNRRMAKMGFPIIASGAKNTLYKLVADCKDPLQQEYKESEYDKYVKLFINKIECRRPVTVKYKPFNKEEQTIKFHPHLLRKYIGKWYVMGISELEGYTPKRFDVAINRIVSVSQLGRSEKYIDPQPSQYDYLRDIVGVYKGENEKTIVRLKAMDMSTHGKLVANPLHSSQEVIDDDDYGIIQLNVIPNGELRGIILSYGSKLKVIAPQYFKEEIQQEIRDMLKSYE